MHYRLLNHSYAAYGQMSYDIATGLAATVGARVTRDKLSILVQQNQADYLIPLGVRASYNQGTRNTNLSFKAGVQYQITPDIMTYASYGRGYKGPGANDNGAATNSNLIVQPGTSDNIEVGLKSAFFQRKLIVNVAAYHTKFHNYQSESYNANVTSFVIQNAGSLLSEGGELMVIASPFKGLTVNGTAAYLKSKFITFLGAECYPGQPTPSCATTGAFDASGYRTPTAPRFTSSLEATYETPVGSGATAFIEGSFYHRSSINYSDVWTSVRARLCAYHRDCWHFCFLVNSGREQNLSFPIGSPLSLIPQASRSHDCCDAFLAERHHSKSGRSQLPLSTPDRASKLSVRIHPPG